MISFLLSVGLGLSAIAILGMLWDWHCNWVWPQKFIAVGVTIIFVTAVIGAVTV